jgi:lambda repressor-like predicted transcriptional regulator
MDILDLLKNPAKAKIVLENAIIEKNKELAETLIPIVKHPYLTYRYAKEIARGKVKDEWEEIIIQNPYASLDYASYVLKGPFPKGEEVIAQNPYTSLDYAYNILKGPFPKGEDTIANSAAFSLYYAKNVLHDRFPKGEKAIIDSEVLDSNNKCGDESDSCFISYVKFLKSINKLDEFLKDHPEAKLWI